MAATTIKPDFSDTMPDVTANLLNSLTAETIWNASTDPELQYYFGNDITLATDGYSELAQSYLFMVGGKSPDTDFYFAGLTERAYDMIGRVSRLKFEEAATLSEADHVLVSFDARNASIEGYFEFPGTLYRDLDSPFDQPDNSLSLGALNSGIRVMTATPQLSGDGEYANWTILHEIGHGLGLEHTHKESNGRALDTVGRFMDNERYSVMSYNGSSDANRYGHAVSLMALDVAALQALYGAEDYATGASRYFLMNAGGGQLNLAEGNVAIGRAYFCIWDSGGIDEIAYANTGKSVLINLNDATLDTTGPSDDLKALLAQIKITAFFKDMSAKLQNEITDSWHHAGGFFSRVLATRNGDYRATDGGFSIAHDADIENADGGNKGDMLIGNEGNNALTGKAGHDTLLGGSGNDILLGDGGRDRLDGGRGDDVLTGGPGKDVFVFSTNHGVDRITDFADGDRIDLSRLSGYSSYGDLKNNHMTDDGGNVAIEIGTDMLVIEGVTKAELGRSDFLL